MEPEKVTPETLSERGRRVCRNYVKALQAIALDPSQDHLALGAVSRADIRSLTTYILLLEEFVAALKSKDQERMQRAAEAIV